MDIRIPKVIVGVDLGEYAPELLGQYLRVWVNPPLGMLREYDEITKGKDEDDPRLYAWYARMLSQHEDPASHWTADELKTLQSADPALFVFVIRKAWETRLEFMSKKKPS